MSQWYIVYALFEALRRACGSLSFSSSSIRQLVSYYLVFIFSVPSFFLGFSFVIFSSFSLPYSSSSPFPFLSLFLPPLHALSLSYIRLFQSFLFFPSCFLCFLSLELSPPPILYYISCFHFLSSLPSMSFITYYFLPLLSISSSIPFSDSSFFSLSPVFRFSFLLSFLCFTLPAFPG